MLIGKDPEEILPREVFEDEVDIFVVNEGFVELHYEVERLFAVHLGSHEASLKRVILVLLSATGTSSVSLRSSTAQNQGFGARHVLAELLEDVFFVLHVLDPLRLVYGRFRYDLKSPELTLVDDEVHWTEFTIANLDAWVVVYELFRKRWCRFFHFFFFLRSFLTGLLRGAKIGSSHH